MGVLLTLFNIRGVGRGERDSDSVILGVAARHFSLFHGLHLVVRERRKQERTLVKKKRGERGGGRARSFLYSSFTKNNAAAEQGS